MSQLTVADAVLCGACRQGLTGSYAQQLVLHALQHIVDRQGSSADVQVRYRSQCLRDPAATCAAAIIQRPFTIYATHIMLACQPCRLIRLLCCPSSASPGLLLFGHCDMGIL